MSEPESDEISTETYLSKICKYLLEKTDKIDFERYEPYIDVLRRLSVPSIDRRILILVEHFAYGPRNVDKDLRSILDLCLVVSKTLKQWVKRDGFAGAFVDSILLSNRLNRLDSKLENVDCSLPEFHVDLTYVCDFYGSLDNWIRRYQSTFLSCTSTPTIKSTSNSFAKLDENNASAESNRRTPNITEASSSNNVEDQRKTCSSSFESPTLGETKNSELTQPESNQLKLVVNRVSLIECFGRRRRTDYLKLPCEPKALAEKVFKGTKSSLMASKKSDKLNEHIKDVCVCLNDIVKRLDDDTLKHTSLLCILCDDNVRFKLGKVNSKQCMLSTKISVKESCQKYKKKVRKRLLQDNSTNELDELYQLSCCKKDSVESKPESNRSKRDENSSTELEMNDSFENAEVFSSTQKESARLRNCIPCHCAEDKKDEADIESNCEKKLREDIEQLNSEIEELCCDTIPRSCEILSEMYRFKSGIGERKSWGGVAKQFQDIGVCTDNKDDETLLSKRTISKSIGVNTNDVDDFLELTNIYVNEIAMCDCKNGDRKNVAVNTDNRNCEKACTDASTNTRPVKCKENSTEIMSFREVRCCNYTKSSCKEREIESINYGKNDFFACSVCNKETNTNDRLAPDESNSNDVSFDCMLQKLCEYPEESTELAGAIISKIKEIVDLNEKIRKVYTSEKKDKNVCSASIQTAEEKKPCYNSAVTTKVSTSCISVKSNAGGSKKSMMISYKTYCEVQQRTSKEVKDASRQTNQVKSTLLPASTQPVIRASEDIGNLEKQKNSSTEWKVVNEDRAISVQVSKSTCFNDSYPNPPNHCHKCNYLQHRCKCIKKSNFLSFLSDHLTRETFEKCKKMLRCILRKILEHARALKKLRRRRCRRQRNCDHSRSSHVKFLKADSSCSHVYHEKSCTRRHGEEGENEDRRECRRTCQDFENLKTCRPRYQTWRRIARKRNRTERLVKARSSPDRIELEDRRCRINAFAAKWNEPRRACRPGSASVSFSGNMAV